MFSCKFAKLLETPFYLWFTAIERCDKHFTYYLQNCYALDLVKDLGTNSSHYIHLSESFFFDFISIIFIKYVFHYIDDRF